MRLILGPPLLANAKALIDVNKGTLLLRDGEDKITFSIDTKSKKGDVKEMESKVVVASGGEPLKAKPTSVLVPLDDVKQEPKAGTKPEGRKKKAWCAKMSHIFAPKQDKGRAKVPDQARHPLELKMGGDKSLPETVADPLSEAS
ncbi:unnamed protein product [Linum trigynum]|uniref:Uncharacterized protein n=1 Tax=Linum trigynum TaxID=586398 RepID=A0AAV2CIZ1_9ROSI